MRKETEYRLSPRRRPGVAAYLEVFILIGVAAAGSVAVLAAGLRLVASAQGADVSVTEGSIRQGAYQAIETVLVQNTGSVSFSSFEVSTSGVSSGASYCYAIYDPVTLLTMTSTCPSMSTDPEVVPVTAVVAPGSAVLVEITMVGQAFAPGSACTIEVTTSAGSQGAIAAVPVPA